MKPLRFLVPAVLVLAACTGPAGYRTETGRWQIADTSYLTPWAYDVDPASPLPEYPRPQMVREEWMNLNGLWEYCIQESDAPGSGEPPSAYDGQILVPFPVESVLSGVDRALLPGEELWYRRTFRVPREWKGRRVLLHFGAVDRSAAVWVNGSVAGSHEGGYDAFTFDITPWLMRGENELVVRAIDPTDPGVATGKQKLERNRWSYEASSGIWQTVWMEPVNDYHIRNLRMIPDVPRRSLILEVEHTAPSAARIRATVLKDGVTGSIQAGTGREPLVLELEDPELWSPEHPYLYGLKVQLVVDNRVLDSVGSYFAMRDIRPGEVNGVVRPLLNGRFVLQTGTLDQGWWPDGLYTAPTDEALVFDIRMNKAMGFNLVRKHVKVECPRWYYWCDRLGMMVWQDVVHRGKIDPEDGSMISEEELEEIRGEEPDAAGGGNAQFEREMVEMIREKRNHPCIVQWCIFNELWGIYDVDRICGMVARLDSTRLIDAQSGGEDKRGYLDSGAGDVIDHHTYGPDPAYQVPEPGKSPNPFRIAVIGEYGGIETRVPGHMCCGVSLRGDPVPLDELAERYRSLQERFIPCIPLRLSAMVYTQLYDTETEMNGLITYDRKVIKADTAAIRSINETLRGIADTQNE